MRLNIFDKLSFVSLFLTIVLLPLFFLPFTNIPIETSKGLLLVVGLVFGIIFWAIARFLDGKIIFAKSWLLVSGFGIVFVFLLSALLSGNPKVSLFGVMFDVGSFWFIFSAFLLMLMSAIVFRTPKRAKIVLIGAILSSVFVLVFQSVHLFFPTMTSLGILTDKTSNVLGSWNVFGLFAGFSCLMFLLLIEFFPISKIEKLVLKIFILISILSIATVNFSLTWLLLGVSSLIIFVYKASAQFQKDTTETEKSKKKYFPVVSFLIVIISLLFFLNPSIPLSTPTPLGNIIPNYLQTSYVEINPSFGATMSITKEVLIKDPVFGMGPNRFGEAWSMYKPQSVNNTQFWNISFNSGSGLLPTLSATTGGLGILAWLVFFILFLIIGARSVFSSVKNGLNWEMMAFFVLSLYLFISSFFYSGGAVIFLLAFAFTGVFVGLVANVRRQEISLSFLNDHRKSFFSILFLIVIIIFSVTILFKYVERFVSVIYHEKAISAPTLSESEDFIGKALSLHSNDLYLRTFSQIYLMKLNSIVGKDSTPLSDTEKADLQTSFDQAVGSAQFAVEYNPSNYLNFQLIGSVYQIAALLGVSDAYDKAFEAYATASKLNPNNPGIKLTMSGVSQALGKTEDAKMYANEALVLKPDYINALISLSQIAESEGNTASAVFYAERALSISPTNTDLINYINSLKEKTNIVPDPIPDTEES